MIVQGEEGTENLERNGGGEGAGYRKEKRDTRSCANGKKGKRGRDGRENWREGYG